MNAKFTSVHIVPKLNATNDPSITSVVNMIEDIANRLDVEVVGKTRVTQDTLAIAIGGDGTMLEAIQIVPVAPSTMTSHPIIVPSSTPIELRVWGGDVTVRADGQIVDDVTSAGWMPNKECPYKVTISPFKNKAKILHFAGWNFFDVLTEKLGWKHD